MKLSMYARIAAVTVLLPLAGCGTTTPLNPMAATVPMPLTGVPGTTLQDQNFVSQAAHTDMFEIQSSQLALQQSHSRAVRAYAQQMIDDHQMTSQKLMALAASKTMTVPTTLDPTLDQQMSVLNTSARTFDRTYIADQVAGHQAAVSNMQAEIGTGTDPDLKMFAQQTLPMVQEHLRMAQRLR